MIKLAYRFSRWGSILISIAVLMFALEAAVFVSFPAIFFSLAIGVGTVWLIFDYTKRSGLDRYYSLMPLGLAVGYFVYWLFGGFGLGSSFFLNTALLTLFILPTGLSYYTWKNAYFGGILYVMMGIFYFLAGFQNGMNWLPILVVAVFILAVGFAFMHKNSRSSI